MLLFSLFWGVYEDPILHFPLSGSRGSYVIFSLIGFKRIPFVFSEGVKGHLRNFGTDEQLAQETGKKKCPCDPKKGCALSHRRIYETMLAEQWACATIFEDDVTLAENFTARIEATIDSIPPFDVILWGFCPGGSKPRHGPKDQSSVPILRYGWPGSCVHAYTVSLSGALVMTQANTPVQVPISPLGIIFIFVYIKPKRILRVLCLLRF